MLQRKGSGGFVYYSSTVKGNEVKKREERVREERGTGRERSSSSCWKLHKTLYHDNNNNDNVEIARGSSVVYTLANPTPVAPAWCSTADHQPLPLSGQEPGISPAVSPAAGPNSMGKPMVPNCLQHQATMVFHLEPTPTGFGFKVWAQGHDNGQAPPTASTATIRLITLRKARRLGRGFKSPHCRQDAQWWW